MPIDVLILAATAVLAVVAVGAAIVAVRASRRSALNRGPAEQVHLQESAASTSIRSEALRSGAVRPAARTEPWQGPSTQEPDSAVASAVQTPARIVDGRIIVPVSSQQLAAAALDRPAVRATLLARSVAHAMRSESRDRIVAIVRRSYRERRRARLRAGRHAARMAHSRADLAVPSAAESWLGELPPAGDRSTS